MQRYLTCVMVIGMSIAFLWHFSNIWIHGTYTIQEQSKLALILETILLVSILAFGIYRAKRELKE
ncbi:hypothetical protein LCGC14_2195080 [marine sediment metagenome]|uniref:Uncharacterized protein n=1 Tax=marine sediment metagenome TaxID=412755 RepID=A0A0F9GE60_9ZZZZ